MSDEADSNGQVDLTGGDLFGWTPPCVERQVPGHGPTWVHGYTGADAAKWRRAARNLARGGEPTPEQYQVAQALWVCRTAPNGEIPTFKVDLQHARQAFEKLQAGLPGKWTETACRESDALTMAGYFPPKEQAGAPGAKGGAERRLGEMLADEEVWTALSVLSLRLYGVPLAENGQPLGAAMAHIHACRPDPMVPLVFASEAGDKVRSDDDAASGSRGA